MQIQCDISSLLTSAYKDGKWSDVTIMNGDKEYRVHKLVLSTSIPYFDKMFSSGLSESTSQVIKLDHPPIVFDLIIEWAYGSKILLTKENAADLFNLSDYMNITQLTSECLNFLWEYDDSPLIDIDHWINKIHVEETRKIIDRYIRSNFCDIVHTDSFLKYSVETVTHMISLRELKIEDEIQVFEAIVQWINADDENRSTHLPELLKKVHWVDIDGEQFMKGMCGLDWIKRCKEARPLIMAALELSFYKSLEQVIINDLNLDSRLSPFFCRYYYSIQSDSNITFRKHFYRDDDDDYGVIFAESNPDWGDYADYDYVASLTADSHLPAAEFGDSFVTEYTIETDDAVIRIDWENGTYRLFKDENCAYSLMCDRLFQFKRDDRNVYLWKGDRPIKLSSIPDNVGHIFTVTKHEGYFYLPSVFERESNAPLYGYANQQCKSKLALTKYDPFANSWEDIGHYEIETKKPIEMLESNAMHEWIEIIVDNVAVLHYYFDTQTFKEKINPANLGYRNYISVDYNKILSLCGVTHTNSHVSSTESLNSTVSF